MLLHKASFAKLQEYSLDILWAIKNSKEKIHKGLEKALNDNELYQSAQNEVDEAIIKLEKAGLSRGQNKVVVKAISATNASGAAYGATAYRQGLFDGVELVLEVNRIGQVGSIINKQDFDSEKII